VYPTLQLLEDAGFVSASQQDTKRVYSITEAGTAELQSKMAAADGTPPWMDAESAGSHDDLRKAVGQLMMAAKQIGMSDNQAQIDATVIILNDARKKLYQLLAEA
jgi:DNA-binding PadR family transcriptional regulator